MTQSLSNAAAAAGRSAASNLPRAAADFATAQGTAYARQALFGPKKRVSAGPNLETIRMLTAGEGGGLPRVFGRARVGGQVIWASEVREETRTVSSTTGAKGVKAAAESSATEYRYFASLAIALCEGPVAHLGRVWADGRPLRLGGFTYRLHKGDAGQGPDPLIEALQDEAPAYLGVAYIVFEDLDLAPFGNRIPQFNFEVVRTLNSDDPDAMENALRAVTIIPATGEAAYATEGVFEDRGDGVTRPLNQHNGRGLSDAQASFDEMQDLLPNLGAASLVVSWFGDDLRAEHCTIAPGAERVDRETQPDPWQVAGLGRADVRLLSDLNGRPSYGGTPSDASVVAAIQDLHDRGLDVAFHPFILMDIPSGNGLTDPYGGSEQAAFPWRGRITAADGLPSTRVAIENFFQSYGGMVRHYAQLCAEAGGVETFLIGSELRGLTRLRDATGAFPAVEALQGLASDVAALLPNATVTYGADWTEYGGYVPEGSDDLFFPLDPLWADPAIGAVGIDNYFPLTDWRDGGDHLDAALYTGPLDPDFLTAGLAGGEGYDWFYASQADREAQVRTPITDGLHQEPWVFRPKDLWSWWLNPHQERLAGAQQPATPWVPQSKPILFTELGCAAIDKGPNQPNVFLDPKSSESQPPYFSGAFRDDRAQRSFLEVHHRFWNDPANNPVSSLTGQPMVDTSQIYVYAWDARPFPDFPARGDVWADAENWTTGHWLNGRAGRVRLGDVIEHVAREGGLSAIDASACDQWVSGFTLERPGSGREALEPLLDLFQLDAEQNGAVLSIRPRKGEATAALLEEELLLPDDVAPVLVERRQDEELPSALSLTFTDELSDFETKVVEVRDETRVRGATARVISAVSLDQGEAQARALAILAEARVMREELRFALPEGVDAVVPGAVIDLQTDDRQHKIRIVSEASEVFRAFEAVSTAPGVFEVPYTSLAADPAPPPPVFGAPVVEVMDLPLLTTDTDQAQIWFAAFADPWPGRVQALPAGGGSPISVSRQSLIGSLTSPLLPGCGGRWDRAAELHVRLPAGALESFSEDAVLAGGHLCAVQTALDWELLQFKDAELLRDGTWRLTNLLRARRGTDEEAANGAEPGARFVLLTDAQPEVLSADLWGQELRFEAGPEGALPGAYPYRSLSVFVSGTGARPFAPVHLRSETRDGEHLVTWIRRTRVGGDQFASGDVPLGEGQEIYEIDLLASDGALLETRTSDKPSISLPLGEVASVTVAQRSGGYGRGRGTALDLS